MRRTPKKGINPISLESMPEPSTPASLRFASVRNRYAVAGAEDFEKRRGFSSLKRVPVPRVPSIFYQPQESKETSSSSSSSTLQSFQDKEKNSRESSRESYDVVDQHLPPKFVRRTSRSLLELEPLGYENDEGWRSHADFLLVCFALSLGLHNVWRLPTHAQDQGAYLLIWIFLMFLVGYPLLFLELSLTYFSNKGPVRIWNAVPILKGVGVAQLYIGFLYSMYFSALASVAFFYLTFGMKTQTWEGCAPAENQSYTLSSLCISDKPIDNLPLSAGEKCFNDVVIEWRGVNNHSFNLFLLPGVFLAYIFVLIGTFKGTKNVKRILAVSSILTFTLLLTFLVYGLSYEGAVQHGLTKLFRFSNWIDGVKNVDLWLSAFSQVLLSMHLSCGVLIGLGSRTKRYGKFVTMDTTLIFGVNLIVGIVSVILTNAWMGVLRRDLQSDSIFNTSFLFALFYDAALKTEANRWLIMALFAILIYMSALNSIIPITFTLSSAIDEGVSNTKTRNTIKLCLLFSSLAGSIFLISSLGYPIIYTIDNFAIAGLVAFVPFFFIVGFVFIYGRSKRLETDFTFWTNNHPGVMKILIKMLSTSVPFALIVGTTLFAVSISLKTYDCLNHVWEVGIIWALFSLGFLIIIIFALREVFVQIDYGIVNKFKSAVKSDLDWGPMDPILQHQWHDYIRYEKNSPLPESCQNVDKTGVVNLNFSDETCTKF